jgi:16S rRNA (guanine527-N7)-methyltransferase
MSIAMPHSLESGALQYGVRLAPPQLAQFERYLALLTDWSSRVNLVGNADADAIVQRHFLESIALGAALRERELLRPAARVLDVGAGAGFPALPMKIVWPAVDVTLIEATAKKAAFLQAVVDELRLDARVITGRAETLGHEATLRETFDLVVARAVAPLRVLLELTMPFARVGGRVVTPKGSRAEAEVAEARGALDLLGGRAFVVPFRVPGPQQRIIAVQKLRATPDAYPRRAGLPAKHPL